MAKLKNVVGTNITKTKNVTTVPKEQVIIMWSFTVVINAIKIIIQ